MQIKITSWNINSVRLRKETVRDFLIQENPDILCLQEIKCQNHEFPKDIFEAIGYKHIQISGQKGYHGTATLSKIPLERLDTQFCPREEARHVSTRVKAPSTDFELHNFYIPAGGDIADPVKNPKFKHKLDFLDMMTSYFQSRYAKQDDKQVLVGDFNIAPHENDVWSHKQLLKVVSHTPIEVERLATLLGTHDFTDCARIFAKDEDKLYSWWSYRARDVFKSNRGRRLDHIWVSPALKKQAETAGPNGFEIHTDWRIKEKPSDHVPVTQSLVF